MIAAILNHLLTMIVVQLFMPESQPVPHEPQRTRSGFTLLELSVSIGIIALMLSGTLTIMSDFAVKQESIRTKDDLQVISDALVAYKDRNGRLPCPASQTVVYGSASYGRQVNAGDCSYTTAPTGTTRTETAASSGKWVLSGAVPVRDLLLRDSFMKDKFGNRYTYVVPQELANASTFSSGEAVINVKRSTGDDVALDGAFALISHGQDGKGAYREGSGALKQACGASTNLDVANCTPGATIMDAPFNDGQVEASYFDDTVVWKSKVDITDPTFSRSVLKIFGETADMQSMQINYDVDVNGDGHKDLAVITLGLTPTNANAYVIYGTGAPSEFPNPLKLADVGSTVDGFKIVRVSGTPVYVSSKDYNGDGKADLELLWSGGQPWSQRPFFVLYGGIAGATYNSSYTTDNFTTNGTHNTKLLIQEGGGIRIGDVNGDGFVDLVSNVFADSYTRGNVRVTFGKAGGWGTSIDLNPDNACPAGYVCTNIHPFSGDSMKTFGAYGFFALGDFNNDGRDDILVSPNCTSGLPESTYSHLIFGKSSMPTSVVIDNLNGSDGVKLGMGGTFCDDPTVKFLDINNDGYDDVTYWSRNLVFGGPGPRTGPGTFESSWVGHTPLERSSLNGTNGFTWSGGLENSWMYDQKPHYFLFDDVNGDGIDDMAFALCSYYYQSCDGYAAIYGQTTNYSWAASLNLGTMTSSQGMLFDITGTSGSFNDKSLAAIDAGAHLELYAAEPTWSSNNGRVRMKAGPESGNWSIPITDNDYTHDVTSTTPSGQKFGTNVQFIDFDDNGKKSMFVSAPVNTPDGVTNAGVGYIIWNELLLQSSTLNVN